MSSEKIIISPATIYLCRCITDSHSWEMNTSPGHSRNCTSSDCLVEIYVPNYREIWDLDLPSYHVHMRYLMIDSETGYRNIFKKKSFLMSL